MCFSVTIIRSFNCRYLCSAIVVLPRLLPLELSDKYAFFQTFSIPLTRLVEIPEHTKTPEHTNNRCVCLPEWAELRFSMKAMTAPCLNCRARKPIFLDHRQVCFSIFALGFAYNIFWGCNLEKEVIYPK